MVMHARKPQRINDGYFEKHQAHPYQNSKYNSSKGNYSDRYSDRGIRESPNGNSYRSDSPENSSPRDRVYQNKVYMQKMREKERDNRDYNSSREKYSECSRSPKDKRRDDRSNHERAGTDDRTLRVGDWSEHISSSGKKYYYNCKSEVSQWEKPREWIERERRHNKEADPRYMARLAHEKHSMSRSLGTGRESSGSNSRGDMGSSAGPAASRDGLKVQSWGRPEVDDMDISPSSTPRSDPDRRLVSCAANSAISANSALVAASASPVSIAAAVPAGPLNLNPVPSKPDDTPLTIDLPPVGTVDAGPPTPTHSEHQDCVEPRKMGSPVSSNTPALSSSLLALRPTVPHLTPTLGNYYREELTNHIKNWPVHAIEKQVLKLSEEIHSLTSIHCTRVSSELKTARAVVRLTEIQATLQEQRILFLRQQIKTLEELNTQHSFMGD